MIGYTTWSYTGCSMVAGNKNDKQLKDYADSNKYIYTICIASGQKQ